MIAGLSVHRGTELLAAGAGVVGTAFVQNSNVGGLDPNVRDVLLAIASVMLIAKTEGHTRLFAMGVGAGAVSSLLRRNIITV